MGDDNQTIKQQACEWSVKLSDEEVDANTLAEFEAWKAADPAHAQAFARAEQVWHGFSELEQLSQQATLPDSSTDPRPSLWSRIATWIAPRPVQLGAALTVILAALLTIWLPTEQAPQQTAPETVLIETLQQQIKETVLADGSQITLGPHSQLRATINAEVRKVELLKGEGFFQVAHDSSRPFVVITGATSTRVLGTVFNVKRLDQKVRIAVKEGKVRVGDTQQRLAGVTLTKGEGVEANLRGETSETITLNAENIGSWKQNRLVYNNATLKELVSDLNRYSNKRVIIASPELDALRVTLSADSIHVDTILDDLSQILPVTINRERVESIIISPR